jgi:peroxiredoxin
LGDARLYAISKDPPETSRAFIEKIEADSGGAVDFTLLSDPDNAVIDRYALRDPAYAGTENDGIPHPAVFVIDRDGIIRWSRIESDYKQRPSVEEIQEALEAAAGDA